MKSFEVLEKEKSKIELEMRNIEEETASLLASAASQEQETKDIILSSKRKLSELYANKKQGRLQFHSTTYDLLGSTCSDCFKFARLNELSPQSSLMIAGRGKIYSHSDVRSSQSKQEPAKVLLMAKN